VRRGLARGGALRPPSDLVLILLILAVGLALRAAFQLRLPVFMTKDSPEYYLPAYQLVTGQGFDLPERRTPLYSLFIAFSIATLGIELQALAFLQHLMGVATAVLAYLLGRQLFNRAVGLVSGLLTAVAAPLLVYEQHVMSETIFAVTLALAAVAFVWASQSLRWWQLVLAGAAVALACLARPIAQGLLPLGPLALLVSTRSWRQTLRATVLVLVGVGLLLGPWIVRNKLVHGTASTAGVGRFLIGRVLKWDRAFVFYPPLAPDAPDRARVAATPIEPRDPLNAARRIAQETTNVGPSPHTPMERLQRELGLTEAQADDLLRQVSIEAIQRNPTLYVVGTVDLFWEALLGRRRDEGIRMHLDEHLQPDVANRFPGLEFILGPPTPAQQAEAAATEWMVLIYQPYRYASLWIPLFLVGALACLLSPRSRPGLLLAFGAPLVLLLSVAVVGGVPRYRYPLDPWITVLALGGASSLLTTLAARLPARSRSLRRKLAANSTFARPSPDPRLLTPDS
jgi:4-amino-4-deoxy-L-arabinose transferase-like glycosyltransferase